MKNPKTWYVWCWCLMKASHEPQKFPFNGKDVELRAGEFITGRKKALKEMKKITPMAYRIAIEYLKTTNRITTKATNKFTIISICNWGQYQVSTTSKVTSKTSNQQPASIQPTTTYKNDKNVKNEKKLLPKQLNPLTLTRGQYRAFLKEFPYLTLEDLKEQRLKCNNYMAMSSSDYTNPGLFFKGWLKQAQVEKRRQELESEKIQELPEISPEEKKRNLKKLAKIRSRFKGGVA